MKVDQTRRKKIVTVMGTRPEVIKLAPIIRHLESHGEILQTVNVTSAQHTDLLYPFIRMFGLNIDYDLHVMEANQTPSQVCARVLSSFDRILAQERPDFIVVQGDTTTALAGALAGFHRRTVVGHVEAGLRSGNHFSPYPEEMNRKLITRLASYHFAATRHNLRTLLSEGVSMDAIFVTGNPIVDSLEDICRRVAVSGAIEDLLKDTIGRRRIILTTHRRESFGKAMKDNLKVLRSFIERYEDIVLVFPVHPNPAVLRSATALLAGHPRIHLINPLGYDEFVALLSSAWLIISDSGGVQEEAPTLGKPLLILRENTERPEAVESGVARLVGGCSDRLAMLLEEAAQQGSWVDRVGRIENPFGRGDSGQRIVHIIAKTLGLVVAEPCTGRSRLRERAATSSSRDRERGHE